MDKGSYMDFLLIFSFCLMICSEISQQAYLKIETSDSKGKREKWNHLDDPLIIAIISRTQHYGKKVEDHAENKSAQITIISAKVDEKKKPTGGKIFKTRITTPEEDKLQRKEKNELQEKEETSQVKKEEGELQDQEEYNQDTVDEYIIESVDASRSMVNEDDESFTRLIHQKPFRRKVLIATMSSCVIIILALLVVLFCMIFRHYKKTPRFPHKEDPDRQYFILPTESLSPLVDSFLSSSSSDSPETSVITEKSQESFPTKGKEQDFRSSPVGHIPRVSSEASIKSKVKTYSSECETASIHPQKSSEKCQPPEKSLQHVPQEPSQNHQPPEYFIRLRKTSVTASLASVVSAEKKWSCVSCVN